MTVLEHKERSYEPEYERTELTDKLHEVFNFYTDYEIINYKKMKKILNTKIWSLWYAYLKNCQIQDYNIIYIKKKERILITISLLKFFFYNFYFS